MCPAFEGSVPPKTHVLKVFMDVRLCRAGHRSGGVSLGKERSVWEVAEGIATTFMCAAVTARARMLEHASPLIRLLGQRDALHHDACLLERELAVFRSRRERKPAHQRPHYSPAERAQIVEIMKLRGWSAKEAGARFIVHPNTIHNWQRAVHDKLYQESPLQIYFHNRMLLLHYFAS